MRTPLVGPLNERHEAYCLLRAAGRIATQAYIECGYRPAKHAAKKAAYELEHDPKIQARILELRAVRFKQLHMDADEVLARVAMVARLDPRTLFDDEGNLRPLHELTEDEAVAIAGVETIEEFSGTGKDRVKVGDVRKVRLRDPMPALRLLAEHKKLVKAPEEGLNALAGAIAERLKAARERKRKESPK